MDDKTLFGITIKTSEALPHGSIVMVQKGTGRCLMEGFTHTISDGEHKFIFRGRIDVIDPPKIVAVWKDIGLE